MRTARLLATACFVVLAAAACGSPAVTAGAASGNTLRTSDSAPPATTSTSPSTAAGKPVAPPIVKAPTAIPVPTLPRTPVPPGQISAPGLPAAPQGVEVTNNGLDVVFTAEEAGCQLITAQVQDQTATAVTILVVTTSTSKGNQVCPMIVREVQVAAQLSSPLASRQLVFKAVTKHS